MNQRQNTAWWNGIVFRSLAAVALVSVALGAVSIAFIRDHIAARAHQEAQQRLGELLDTVESTASVACFANDAQLAREVVQGLLRNSEVLRVTIFSGAVELASGGRASRLQQAPVSRPLPSPFNRKQTIGAIRLEGNWDAILSRTESNVRYAMLVLTGQLLLVIAGTAGMVFVVVARPIKAASDCLHRLDPASGGRLAVPAGHERTEIGRLVADINDLSERLVDTLDQERELRRQQEVAQRKYQNLFEHASSGIFVATADGALVSFNQAFVALTWMPQGRPDAPRNLGEPGWDRRAHLFELLAAGAAQLLTCNDDFLLRGRRGDERWLNVAIVPLGDGSVQGTVSDVTQRKREEISARRLAVTDSLTGCANRDGLLQAFASLNPASLAPFATVVINLDGFKQVNDGKGIPAGDQVLLRAARRIRAAGSADDYLARLGGDEFALVLAGAGEKADVARRVAALHAHLCEPYELDEGGVSLGASIGIAFFPQDGTDMPQLLHGAELALNSAREPRGAAGYAFFEPQLQAAAEHRRRLEDDLRLAVGAAPGAGFGAGPLQLYFQPIIDLNGGRVAGAEALLRWQHAERGFISPEVFIPLAERVGLIGEIGRRVLEQACQQVAAWRRDGSDMYVSVNVSACQIPDELPPAAVLAALRRHHLPAAAVAIEITEGVLMSDIGVAQRWIEQLRAEGLRVYLDDFGTGYSSLSYLKRFPMDTVKIDKSFIMDMNADNSDSTLVNAIITMAASLGLDVVAEGVEEEGQLRLLREMGCGYGQGYYFSRPVAAADFGATATRINAELAIADEVTLRAVAKHGAQSRLA